MPKRESSLKNGVSAQKQRMQIHLFALEEVGWEPAAGKHEGKEGRY